MDIKEELFKLKDEKYKEFQSKLFPTLDSNTIIGVRTTDLKKLSKKLIKEKDLSFLNELPHKYFDENQLHAFIISEIKDYNECLKYINLFLPYIDNWATCDQLSPKVFKKNLDDLIKQIKKWIKSSETYVVRFGIGMLMQYYLGDNFKEEYFALVLNVKSEEYYVNMMRSWYFATALAYQYDITIKIIEENKLDVWTHNKTIRKAIESNRITNEQKDYLRTLKR